MPFRWLVAVGAMTIKTRGAPQMVATSACTIPGRSRMPRLRASIASERTNPIATNTLTGARSIFQVSTYRAICDGWMSGLPLSREIREKKNAKAALQASVMPQPRMARPLARTRVGSRSPRRTTRPSMSGWRQPRGNQATNDDDEESNDHECERPGR